MNDFRDFIDSKEENALNEDAGMAAAVVLGLPTVALVSAYGGAQLLFALSKGLKGITRSWNIAIKEFKEIKDVKDEDVSKYMGYARKDPLVNKIYNDEKQNLREYGDLLKDVYSAIDEKSYGKETSRAKEEFLKLPKNIQNSPDVKRAIINAIIKSTGEPPIWPPSPGNITYQAIKYTIGIREAKAQATAFKYNAVKSMEKINNE